MATPHKVRLTALHEISLHIFRPVAQKFLDSLPAGFMHNPTKNLTAQLSHRLGAV